MWPSNLNPGNCSGPPPGLASTDGLLGPVPVTAVAAGMEVICDDSVCLALLRALLPPVIGETDRRGPPVGVMGRRFVLIPVGVGAPLREPPELRRASSGLVDRLWNMDYG